MKKRFFAVFSLILAAVFLVACSSQSTGEKNWEKIEKRGSIKVATAGTLYPQTYHDDKNNLTGYDVEILKEVGKRLKLKIDFTEMGVDGMLTAVNSGQVDIANYSLEDDNKNVKKFLRSEPYKYSFTSMVVRESDNSGISSWKDLKGKKAAGAASTKYMKIAKKWVLNLSYMTMLPTTLYARLGKWSYRRYRQRLLFAKDGSSRYQG